MNKIASTLSLAVRNLMFTLAVPVSGAVLLPWWVLSRFDNAAAPTAWPAVGVIAVGVAPLPVVPLALRRRGTWHSRSLGRAAAFRRGGALRMGAQSGLHLRAARGPG